MWLVLQQLGLRQNENPEDSSIAQKSGKVKVSEVRAAMKPHIRSCFESPFAILAFICMTCFSYKSSTNSDE